MDLTPRPEVSSLLTDMLSAYSGVQQFLNQVESRDHRQVEEATRRTHSMLQQGLETGSRTLTTTGLLGLVSQCHTLRGKDEYAMSERLQPYLDSLGHLIRKASDVLGMVECPLPDASNYTAPACKKRRRRLEERVEKSLTNDMQTTVLKSLRDPSNQRESHISAAEHKLLCTIIPESALLPDIAAMHDLYHPNVCLYDTTKDRFWDAPMAVHLGFAATTMLHDFALHRGNMRRITLVHVMQRMGFGAADINFYITYLDDTFYRRIVCDSRIGFLAESFSPQVRVYRGQHWVQLWDCFLSNRHREDGIPWTKLTRTATAADDIVHEMATGDPQQLLPTTALAALHRHHGTKVLPYDDWAVMDQLVELESAFLVDVRTLRQGTVQGALDACRTSIRAWPMCLRGAVVDHIRLLVQSLCVLPRSPQVVECAVGKVNLDLPACRDWLWALSPRSNELEDVSIEGDVWTSSPTMLLQKLAEHMCGPTTEPQVLLQCEEIEEEAFRAALTIRYGAVNDEHRNKMKQHLDSLATLVHAAGAHSPALWPERRRRAYGYRPSEVFASIRQEVELLTPQDYEAATAQRLRVVLDDPVGADLGGESMTGDSQLRPRTLYPDV